MPELVTKSVAQEKQDQKIETRMAVERIAGFAIVTTSVAVLAVLGAMALYAQGQNNDKYSLKSPSGIAFSDFRGYEDWAVVSSARTDEILTVIVANPAMINAYKAGVPVRANPHDVIMSSCQRDMTPFSMHASRRSSAARLPLET